jgi:hypothetical protein
VSLELSLDLGCFKLDGLVLILPASTSVSILISPRGRESTLMLGQNNTTNKKKAQDIVVCADWKVQRKPRLISRLIQPLVTRVIASGWIQILNGNSPNECFRT